MKVITLIGSRRENGFTTAIARHIGSELSNRGAEVVEWHPETRPLPIADPAFEPESMDNPDSNVVWLSEQIQSADGLIWATPVYHNSYSGVLKNALDSISQKYFEGKVVGLLGNNGSRSTQAVDHLRLVARGVGALCLVNQVCVSRTDFETNESGLTLANDGIAKRASKFVDELFLRV